MSVAQTPERLNQSRSSPLQALGTMPGPSHRLQINKTRLEETRECRPRSKSWRTRQVHRRWSFTGLLGKQQRGRERLIVLVLLATDAPGRLRYRPPASAPWLLAMSLAAAVRFVCLLSTIEQRNHEELVKLISSASGQVTACCGIDRPRDSGFPALHGGIVA